MPPLLERYQADRASLERCSACLTRRDGGSGSGVSGGVARDAGSVPFDTLSRSDRVDWLLFRSSWTGRSVACSGKSGYSRR